MKLVYAMQTFRQVMDHVLRFVKSTDLQARCVTLVYAMQPFDSTDLQARCVRLLHEALSNPPTFRQGV